MKALFLTLWISLRDRPLIGAVSGVSTGIITAGYDFITDEKLLKMASAFAVWVGMLIAFLTLIIKMVDVYDKVKAHFKTPNKS